MKYVALGNKENCINSSVHLNLNHLDFKDCSKCQIQKKKKKDCTEFKERQDI